MRATRAVIHLENLAGNIRAVRGRVGAQRSILIPVKADAYGHGAIEVSRAALAAGATHLAVASADEGMALRRAGIEAPLLLFSLAMPEEYPALLEAGIEPLLGDEDSIGAFGRAARRAGRIGTVHLKIDTGMGRIGCPPSAALGLAAAVSRERGLGLGGIFTHFPVADSEAADDLAFTRAQIETFRGVAEELARAGLKPAFASAANSGAVLLHPDSWMDMVRPGILVYGYPPVSVAGFSEDIRPVMEFLTCIVFMKRVQAGSPVSYGRTWSAPVSTVIATLPAGYADGYPRALSNRAEVWVGGRRRPVAGRVCMDQLMVDLGPEGGASLHDDVVLFGPGAGVPGADELAAIAGTIPYEITCGINKRVPRVYEGGGLSA